MASVRIYKDIQQGKIVITFSYDPKFVNSTLQVPFEQKSDNQAPNQAKIKETVKNELKLRGYSLKTRKAYLHHIERYINYRHSSSSKEREETSYCS